jgi:hypothetical protein
MLITWEQPAGSNAVANPAPARLLQRMAGDIASRRHALWMLPAALIVRLNLSRSGVSANFDAASPG